MDRRGARLVTEIETTLSDGFERSKGIITEISRTGALIEAPDLKLPVGTLVDLTIAALHGEPIELEAKVVRHTTNMGFAVEFSWAPVDLLTLLDRLGAGS